MILTEESLRNLISDEIKNQVILENMRSQITEEDRLLVSLLSESESLEDFTDRLSMLNESISSTIAGLLGMTAGGPSRTTEGVWNGLKRWFFGKLVGMLGIKTPEVRDALAAFITEIEFRELLQIWRGEESACQEVAEAIVQGSVFSINLGKLFVILLPKCFPRAAGLENSLGPRLEWPPARLQPSLVVEKRNRVKPLWKLMKMSQKRAKKKIK